MNNLSTLDFVESLPEAIRQDRSMRGLAYALQRQFRKLASSVDSGALYSNIDEMTSLQLDHLATMFNLQIWRDHWPLQMKRRVMKTAFQIKRKVGTVSAVKDALESIGSASEIVEWWQTTPKGDPHTFNIIATLAEIDGTLTSAMQEDLQLMIRDTKPARSHFSFTLSVIQKGGVGLCGYARPLVTTRISDV